MNSTTLDNILVHANLQMAAEAFFGLRGSPPNTKTSGLTDTKLTDGNGRASLFPLDLAQSLMSQWTLVAQMGDTATGFSGSLFQNTVTKEYVISFRSTEFADDSVRDNQATNTLEIKDFGWAFGQIADMEIWYQSLISSGRITALTPLSVTGYSLGGHLATAFALLHPSVASAVYTFNGAGVGTVQGSLANVIQTFNAHRAFDTNEALFTGEHAHALYVEAASAFRNGTSGLTSAQADAFLGRVRFAIDQNPGEAGQLETLYEALGRVRSVLSAAEAVAKGIPSGSEAPSALIVPVQWIEAASLDYQIAVLSASKGTSAFHTGILQSGYDGYAGRHTAGSINNFYDVYGASPPSAVSNSQYHYGSATPIYVEDQPLKRGNVAVRVLADTVKAGEARLLVDNFSQNDFGDTHSLALLVDSLRVQSILATLDPTLTTASITPIFESASWLATFSNGGQGQSEGDLLENVVNALGAMLALDGEGSSWHDLKGDPSGGSWALMDDHGTFTGRLSLHQDLDLVQSDKDFAALAGAVRVLPMTPQAASAAKNDFGVLAALESLSPFYFEAATTAGQSALNALWQSAWSEQYSGWTADAAARSAGGTPSAYTDEWYRERGAFLDYRLIAGRQNSADASGLMASGQIGKDTVFLDADTGLQLTVNTDLTAHDAQFRERITFGSSNDESITGGVLADHLFGAEGNDSLSGLDGADYLEGDGGDDILTGGLGDDTLVGGAGTDTYTVASGTGHDTIVDTDGILLLDGIQLHTGDLVAANVWKSSDGKAKYTLLGGNLEIAELSGSKVMGSITVKGWHDGDLGIQLAPGGATPPLPADTIAGDANVSIPQDDLVGTPDRDLLLGFSSDDLILGLGEADRLEGGTGNDVLMGGMGADTLDGGDGNDLIYGSSTGSLPVGSEGSLPPGQTVLAEGLNWRVTTDGQLDSKGAQAWYLSGTVGRDEQFGDDGNSIDAGAGNDVVDAGTGDDDVQGGDGNDTILGMGGSDVIAGDDGNDMIWGDSSVDDVSGQSVVYTPADQHAADFIDGGAGNDTVYGQGGDDILYGGSGNDQLLGDDRTASSTPLSIHGADYLDGEEGDDTLTGGGKDDTLIGGAGNDTLYGDGGAAVIGSSFCLDPAQVSGDDYLDGGEGDDGLVGQGGDDTLYGGAGNDLLQGDDVVQRLSGEYHGNDYLDGGEGDDTLFGMGGSDTLHGGAGADQLHGDSADLAATFHGDDYLDGEDGNDTLDGGGGNDELHGGGGDDQMRGDSSELAGADNGNDYLDGGDGNDTMAGDGGNDTLFGGAGNDGMHGDNNTLDAKFHGNDYADGEDGNDTIIGGGGSDTLLGGEGDDQLYGDGGGSTADFALQYHGKDVLDGGDGNDQLVGGGNDDSLTGGAGNDTLFGDGNGAFGDAEGNDMLDGGEGDDQLVAGGGNDTLDGGQGNDKLWGDAGNDQLDGGDGDNTLNGGAGDDTLVGGVGNDAMFGDEGADVLLSASTLSYLDGGDGNDYLDGGATEIGGTGDDTLVGADGRYMDGGAGNDTYVYDYRSGDKTPLRAQDLSGANVIQIEGIDPAVLSLSYVPGTGGVYRLATGHGTIDMTGITGGAIATVVVDDRRMGAGEFYGHTFDTVQNLSTGSPGVKLQGGRQADMLSVTGGNSTLAGGSGNDTLRAAGGSNTILFFAGDQSDTLTDTGSGDTVSFGAGLDRGDVRLTAQPGGFLGIGFVGTTDSLEISGFDPSHATQASGVGAFKFADGSILTFAQLLAQGLDVQGTWASETLTGSDVGDRLNGGAGDDTLTGGGGADAYRFDIGDGADVIADGDPGSGAADVLAFGAGIGAPDILASRTSTSVTFVRVGSGDEVTLSNYFAGGPDAVEQIRFEDGTQWGLSEVLADVAAGDASNLALTGDDGANVLIGLGGNDAISGFGGDDTLRGGPGNDTLSGGAGADSLVGGPGSDTYVIGGGGLDTLDESGGDGGGIDSVFFEGMASAEAAYSCFGNDLYVTNKGTGVRVASVLGQLAADNPATQVERFVFADGVTMTMADILPLLFKGGNSIDSITGSALGDPVAGGWGADTLAGASGNDTLHGNQGNDSVMGDSGNDYLAGDEGNDTLLGGDGNDTLDGGAGWDRLDGGAGDDTYLFGTGSGMDILVQDAGGQDSVLLAAGITAANVTLARVASPPAPDLSFTGDSLVIQISNGGDQLWIANYFAALPGTIESIRFADGTVWNQAAIASRVPSSSTTVNTQAGTTKSNTFTIDNWNDVVSDPSLSDADTITGTTSYRLPDAVNNLTLAGTLDLFGVGGASSDKLTGNAGSNRFEFITDAVSNTMGNDTLAGGKGDDVYVLGETNTTVQVSDSRKSPASIVELAGEGNDTLVTGYWSQVLPDNVENLIAGNPNGITTGNFFYYNPWAASDYTHRFTGNALNNVVDASAYEELVSRQRWYAKSGVSAFRTVLDFRIDGAAGADTMVGGAWNDTYVIDNNGDKVIELGVTSDGRDLSIDTVETPFDTSLTQFPNIENITLVGTSAVFATGNAVANRLDGSANSAANKLTGGAGDDTYIVGVGDYVVELAGEGSDTVVVMAAPGATAQLSDYPNVENLAVGPLAGNLGALGDDGNNVIKGNQGNNSLSGGAGDDRIVDQDIADATFYSGVAPASDADILDGGQGDDFLSSYGGADTLAGGAGNDTLRVYFSGRSVDVRISAAGGQDVLAQDAGVAADVTIELDAGVGLRDVQIQKAEGSYFITLPDGTSLSMPDVDSISLRLSDGTVLGPAQVDAMVRTPDRTSPTEQADLLVGSSGADLIASLGGDDFVDGGAGADTIDGGTGNDTLYGGDGADSLTGNGGNDILAGGPGADVYHLSRGFGIDLIDDTYLSPASNIADDGATDIVEFDATVMPADVAIYQQLRGSTPTGLVLAVTATGDEASLQHEYAAGISGQVELVRFANGTQWDLPTLKSKITGQVGSDTDDTLSAPFSNARLEGRGGNDTLTGGAGNDTLDGGTGTDKMSGGTGNDTYFADSLGDVVIEASRGGTDTVLAMVDGYVLPTNVENLQMLGTSNIGGTGNSVANALTGNSGANRLDGGAGSDTMTGGAGDDTYVVDSTGDVIVETAGGGIDTVETALSWTLGTDLERLTLTGTGKVSGTGNALANWIAGNEGANILNGAGGADALLGGGGSDKLQDTSGNNVLDGGAGSDTETGGLGNDLVAGGVDADTLTLGGGADVVAFDGGDGSDTVGAPASGSGLGEANDTLSLGRIRLSQITFSKETNDLVIRVVGTADAVRMTGWYASSGNQTFTRLQVVIDSTVDFVSGSSDPLRANRIEVFDLKSLVAAYDTARGATTLGNWAPSGTQFLAALMLGSDTSAYGGQFAYRYALDGTIANTGYDALVTDAAAAGFGATPQAISPASPPLAAPLLATTSLWGEVDAWTLSASGDQGLAMVSGEDVRVTIASGFAVGSVDEWDRASVPRPESLDSFRLQP